MCQRSRLRLPGVRQPLTAVARPRKKSSETIGEFHLLISAATISPETAAQSQVTQPAQCVLTTICKLRHDVFELSQHIVSDSHAFGSLETILCCWLASAEHLPLLANNSAISGYRLHVHKVCHSLFPILDVLLCGAACNARCDTFQTGSHT